MILEYYSDIKILLILCQTTKRITVKINYCSKPVTSILYHYRTSVHKTHIFRKATQYIITCTNQWISYGTDSNIGVPLNPRLFYTKSKIYSKSKILNHLLQHPLDYDWMKKMILNKIKLVQLLKLNLIKHTGTTDTLLY